MIVLDFDAARQHFSCHKSKTVLPYTSWILFKNLTPYIDFYLLERNM